MNPPSIFIEYSSIRGGSFGIGKQGDITLWNLNLLINNIENFSFGNKPKTHRMNMGFSKSDKYIISIHNDSLILYNNYGNKLNSVFFKHNLWNHELKFSNNDKFFSLKSGSFIDNNNFYCDIEIFSLPDLRKSFEKRVVGPSSIAFYPCDDTVVVYNQGKLKFYDNNFVLFKEKKVPALIGKKNPISQHPQINYPYISGVTTGGNIINHLYLPDNNCKYVIYNFEKDTSLSIDISEDIRKAIQYSDSIQYVTLFCIFSNETMDNIIKWNGLDQKLTVNNLSGEDLFKIKGNLSNFGMPFIKNNYLIFNTYSFSVFYRSIKQKQEASKIQNNASMHIYEMGNSKSPRSLKYDVHIDCDVLKNSFIDMNYNLYDYDFRVFLSMSDEYSKPETSNDGKYLILYSNIENRIVKVPLFPEEIIKRVRINKEFGVIRDFTEQEKNEFQITNF